MSYIEPKVNQVAIVRDGELVINITVKLSLAGITVNVGNEVQSNENGAEGQPAPCQTHSRTKQDEHHEPLSTLPKGSNDVSPTPADDTAPHEPQNGVPTADTDKQKTPIHIVEGQPVCNGTNSGYCKEVPEGQNTIPREEGERTLGQPVNCGTHSDVVSSEAGKKGNESLLSPPKDGNYAGPVCNGTNSG